MIGSESTTDIAPVPPNPPPHGPGRTPTRGLNCYQSLKERLSTEASKAVCPNEAYA